MGNDGAPPHLFLGPGTADPIAHFAAGGAGVRAILDLLPVGVVIFAGDGDRGPRVVHANPAFAQLAGHGPQPGSPRAEIAYQVYPPDRRAPVPVEDWPSSRAIAHGQVTQECELHIRRSDGAWRVVLVSAAPLALAGGTPGAVMVMHDLTAREHADDALRASEQRLRLALDSGQMGTWEWDVRTGRSAWNEMEYHLLGIPVGDGRVETDLFFRQVHPDDFAGLRQYLAEMMEGGGEWTHEFRIVRPDGEVRWLAGSGRVFRDSDGRPLRMIGVNYDITERKHAEAALRRSEAERATALVRYRTLFEAMAEGVALHEVVSAADGQPENYRIIDVNPAYEAATGLRREDVVGRLGNEAYGTQAPPFAAEYLAAAQGRRPSSLEVWFPPLARHFRISVAPWGANGFATLFSDITDEKHTATVRERLATVFEALPDLVATADVRARLMSVNRAGREMLGLGEDEDVTSHEIWEFCTAETRALWQGTALQAAEREGAWRGEAVMVSAAGREVPVSQVVQAHRRPDGTIDFYSTMARDISGQKRLEEELRQAQKMEAVGRLAGGVAHDFNNLLTPIIAYSQFLCEALDTADVLHHYAVEIASAAERAAGLPRQLLAFSRKQVIQPRVLDLNEIVSEMERMLRRLIGEDILLSVVPGVGLGKVKADPGQIEQVLMNLAVNARDAMPVGGRLTIETVNAEVGEAYTARRPGVRPGRYVVLLVSDTGFGMDQETLARIFEPFFTTKDVDKGTGLGLSTVYGIVKQSGGEIHVYSEPGKGTTFRVYLPRVDLAADHPAEGAAPAGMPWGSETVLLVEDEENVRAATRAVLAMRGYAVLAAENAEAGLAASRAYPGPIHLLLTDVVMPGMSGPQLAEALAGERPEMRVLFMSGYTDAAIVRHGVLPAGMAFLQKPFPPGVLLRMMRDVLSRTEPA